MSWGRGRHGADVIGGFSGMIFGVHKDRKARRYLGSGKDSGQQAEGSLWQNLRTSTQKSLGWQGKGLGDPSTLLPAEIMLWRAGFHEPCMYKTVCGRNTFFFFFFLPV